MISEWKANQLLLKTNDRQTEDNLHQTSLYKKKLLWLKKRQLKQDHVYMYTFIHSELRTKSMSHLLWYCFMYRPWTQMILDS